MASLRILLAAWTLFGFAAVTTAEDAVFPGADAVRPLAMGKAVPSVVVTGVDGETQELAALAREQGALLVFYRGGW